MGQQISDGNKQDLASGLSTLQPANVQASVASMASGINEYSKSAMVPHPGTVQTLEHAVRNMQPRHVEHILHSGVNVNEPIDQEGHTVLDAFAVEHLSMLKRILDLRTSPEEKTRIFYTNQENARRVHEILTRAGAEMSTPENARFGTNQLLA
uniref:Uncharacterized protein n=1 Tax=Karlodinium veneficum TaxID=407301 RepID=A7WQ14_KARVE|nr:unknown [Karlodinium veneficum]